MENSRKDHSFYLSRKVNMIGDIICSIFLTIKLTRTHRQTIPFDCHEDRNDLRCFLFKFLNKLIKTCRMTIPFILFVQKC